MKNKKHLKFLEKLIVKNKHYAENKFSVISEYTKSANKITVKTKYGVCELKAGTLLEGGMPGLKCALNKTKYIISRFKEIWRDKYDYSKFSYLGSGHKSVIICKKHGEFKCTADNHIWRKTGCPKCGDENSKNKRQLTTEQFIEKAIKVHGDKYDYSKVNYTGSHNKVEIICKQHESFFQKPNGHLANKNGCPICNSVEGFHTKESWCNIEPEKEGILYLIEVYNEEERFLKIGITKNSVKQRYRGKVLPYKYKILKEIKSLNRELIWDSENRLKEELKQFKYKPKIFFAGAYECFEIEKLNIIYEQFNKVFKLTKK